jgi:uncharacterized membrane protein YfcA
LIFIPSLLFLLPHQLPGETDIYFIAVATSLFAAVFSSGGAFVNHFRAKNICVRKALFFLSGSLLSAIFLPQYMSKIDAAIPKLILLSVLIVSTVKLLFEKQNIERKILLHSDYPLILIGAFVGAIAVSSGIGGGVIVVPVLVLLYGLEINRAIGTSVMVVMTTLIVISISYAFASSGHGNGSIGHLNLYAGIPLGVGAIVGSRIGKYFMNRLSASVIRKIFSLFLIMAIVKIILSL